MARRPETAQPVYQVLGPVGVHIDGTEIAVPSGTQRTLLAVLLLGHGRAVSRDRLCRGLWGEQQPRDPRGSLHTAVARLRRTLGPAGATLRTAPPGYALGLAPRALDADRFTELHARARHLLHDDSATTTASSAVEAARFLEAALSLWRGPAWGEFADAMASGEALRLEEGRLAAREDLATALLLAGDPAAAVGRLQQLVEEHPLRDRAVALLVDALHQYGRTADALSLYDHYRARLADELGLDPSPTMRALHQRVLRQELRDATVPAEPSVRPIMAQGPTAQAPPSTTAATGTTVAGGPRLVGREEEVSALAGLVAGGGLVTLVGPGGVGKTRLAEHVAITSDRQVCWVDLVPVRDQAGVVQAMADALHLDGPPEAAVQAALREQFATEPALLVLDNCEHVLNEVATVLSQATAPNRTVLSTSRERLGLPGERVVPLGPLAVPAPGTTAPDAPAVVLFLERARDAGVDLASDPQAVRRVGEVCRSLDGLPLAVELGAARMGTLSLDDLADRLDRRFDLLTRGVRVGPSRHRSLRAVVDWSFDLLDHEERAMFTNLAVFAAGFDLRAVEAVLGDHVVPVGCVADVVARLAARSMLVRPAATGTGKYRMLETLRQYAASRLAPDELAEVRRRHAQWAIDLADQARSGLDGPEEGRWAVLMDDLVDDLRAAWRWAREADDLESAERLVAATWRWAQWRLRADVLAWGQQLVRDRPEGAPDVAYLAAAGCAWLAGDLEAADSACLHADGMARDPERRAELAELTGDVHLARSELEAAVVAYHRAAVLAAERGDLRQEAMALGNEVLARSFTGRRSQQQLQRALSLARVTRNPSAMAFVRYAEGEACAESEPSRAREALDEAQRLAESVGNRLTTGLSLTASVALRARAAEIDPATFRLFGLVVSHWATTRNPTLLVTALRNLVVLLGRVQDDEGALELWAAVERLDSDHSSFGEEAQRLSAVIATAGRRLGAAAAEDAAGRGRGRQGIGAVSALAQQLCRAHSTAAA